jgi:hypothetical protein
MKINILKAKETVIIESGNVDSFHVFPGLTGLATLAVTLQSGRKVIVCERKKAEECFKELQEIFDGEKVEKDQKRDDVVLSLNYEAPAEPPAPLPQDAKEPKEPAEPPAEKNPGKTPKA